MADIKPATLRNMTVDEIIDCLRAGGQLPPGAVLELVEVLRARSWPPACDGVPPLSGWAP